ncbi:hypothetical protein CDAR_487521 [Caerostris darwini]|uniref:Uncharacterized protein n=1 Tax=Caerostris darwini TaxID=1538125 RepID=A0AAV4PRI4_9ARAC|nr:hypothetical protein CDAR_487521 [Caerostris darwini]
MQQKKITKDLPVVNNWETFYTPFADREKGAPGVLEEHELARDYELLLVMFAAGPDTSLRATQFHFYTRSKKGEKEHKLMCYLLLGLKYWF